MAEATAIALVEPDPDLRLLLQEVLRACGAAPIVAGAVSGAEELLTNNRARGLVLRLEDFGEHQLESAASSAHEREIPVAVLANVDHIEDAALVLSLGPVDFIPMPSPVSVLHGRLARFVRRAARLGGLFDLRETLARDYALSHRILGYSTALHVVLRHLPLLAAQSAPALLVGEAGSGKRLVAEVAHDLGPRAAAPFRIIECASTPPDELDDQLFERVLPQVDGGTLVLADIEELPLRAQARLVSLVTRRALDARLIGTTSVSLAERVEEGRFRDPLFALIGELRLTVPPLRDRLEDIPLLANAFLADAVQRGDSTARGFSPEALEQLVSKEWPGNVAELRDAVRRLATQATGRLLTAAEVGGDARPETRFVDLEMTFHEAKAELTTRFEREYVLRLLDRHEGNVSQAAKAAGLDRRSLTRLKERHQLGGRRSADDRAGTES